MKTTSPYRYIALALVLLGAIGTTRAYDFMATDGWGVPIYVNVVDGNAVITNNGVANCYKNTVDIPSVVSHDGHNYTVTAIGDSAFMNCRHLANVELPSTVTSIGRCAFMNCSELNYQTVRESVTTIGEYAFKNCTKMSAFYLYSGLETIGKGAFMNCRSMLGVGNGLGNKLTSIGDSAFMNCEALKTVIMGYSIQSIGTAAFAGCPAISTLTCKAETPPTVGDSTCFASFADQAKLVVGFLALHRYQAAEHWSRFKTFETFTDGLGGIYYEIDGDQATVTYRDNSYNSYCGDVVIPGSFENGGVTYHVVAIGQNAFKGSTELTSVTIPSSVTEIKDYAFMGTSKLTSVTIPPSVTKMGAHIFKGSGLVSFTLPDQFTSTSEFLLEECHSLRNVTLPEGLTTIAKGTFVQCTQLEGLELPEELKVIADSAFVGCGALTDIVLPEGLTTIGDYAFYNAMSYSTHVQPFEITIPESVTYLGKYAFAYATFTSFTLPKNITTVSEGLLYATNRMRTITLHDNVTSIESRAFMGSKITSFEIPASVKVIGDEAFNNTALFHITIPNSVESLGKSVFIYNFNLESVHIGSGIKELGEKSFMRNSKLTSVTFDPESQLTAIGNSAFSQCTSLESIDLPSSVKSIAGGAFLKDTALKHISLGDSLITLGSDAFEECTALEFLTLPATVRNIGEKAFNKCYQLKELLLPDSLESLGTWALASCRELKKIRIPDRVTWLPARLVSDCVSLETAVIGNSVNGIGIMAFYNCPALKDVIVLNTTPPTLNKDHSLSSTTNVYVPEYSAYAEAPMWKDLNLKGMYHKKDIKISVATIEGENETSLTGATLYRCLGDTLHYEAQDNIVNITGMVPTHNDISIDIMAVDGGQYHINDVIETDSVRFTNYSSLRINDKLIAPMFTINCDISFVPDSCGVIYKNNNYPGSVTLNYGDSCLIECAPITKGQPYSHKITPWVAVHGITFTGEMRSIKEDLQGDPNVSPTAVDIPVSKIITDEDVPDNAYFSFEGNRYNNRLRVTGLEPETTYHATCVISDKNGTRTIPIEFTTPPLRMVATEAANIDLNIVRFKGWSNIVDEETGCGYEWERVGVEGTTKQKPAFSFDGYLANIVNRIALNTPYRYRPYYQSAAGNVYYGDWKEFSITEDVGNYAPLVYLYKDIEVAPTSATIHGLVLQGSGTIKVQQLEVQPNKGDKYYVDITGQQVEHTLTGLKPSSTYSVLIKVFAEQPHPSSSTNNTVYSGRRYFTTLQVTCDVNRDGEVNIADVNSLINVITSGSDYNSRFDVNCDGEVNVADVNAVIRWILQGN